MSDGDGWFDGFDPLSALLIGFLLADQRDTTVGHHHRDYWSDGPMRTAPPHGTTSCCDGGPAPAPERGVGDSDWPRGLVAPRHPLGDAQPVDARGSDQPSRTKGSQASLAAARANRGGGQKLPSTTYLTKLSSASSRAAPSAPRMTLALASVHRSSEYAPRGH